MLALSNAQLMEIRGISEKGFLEIQAVLNHLPAALTSSGTAGSYEGAGTQPTLSGVGVTEIDIIGLTQNNENQKSRQGSHNCTCGKEIKISNKLAL